MKNNTASFVILWDIDNLASRPMGPQTVAALNLFAVPQGLVSPLMMSEIADQMQGQLLSPEHDFDYALDALESSFAGVAGKSVADLYAFAAQKTLESARKNLGRFDRDRIIVITDQSEHVDSADAAGYRVYQWLKGDDASAANPKADRIFTDTDLPHAFLVGKAMRAADVRKAISMTLTA